MMCFLQPVDRLILTGILKQKTHCCTLLTRWSIQIPKGQYRDHLVGQLTSGWGDGGWVILDLLLVSKASLNLKIFREGWSLSNLCIAISIIGWRRSSWPSTLSKLTGLLTNKWQNGFNTGLLTTLLLFLYMIISFECFFQTGPNTWSRLGTG